MKKKLTIICILLGIIIALQVCLIFQNIELKREIINGTNYLSEKIDSLTSYIKEF